MKDFLKSLLAIVLFGLSIFSLLFTLLYTVGIVCSWGDENFSNKFGLVIFWILTLFIMGVAGQFLDRLPAPKKKPKTGLEFEHYCAELLTKKGFKHVIVTPPSGDYGADLIAYDRQGNKWVFQCKYYKGKVSISAVQEIAAAKAHYGASKAGVMTNSQLTQRAKQLAIENEILLFELLCD